MIMLHKCKTSYQNFIKICLNLLLDGIYYNIHCETGIVRTYPAGVRIDSSNFNPVFFWSFGIQMVAMNYQTEDTALHLNTAMFEQNGNCGYVLKPPVMWDRSHEKYGQFNPWEKKFDGVHSVSVSLRVISGQYVCPSTHSGSPILETDITGIPVDCRHHKSRIIHKNSLNPIWNDDFDFKVSFSPLTFICFTVTDVSTGQVTSQRVVPLMNIKQGYRHVRLRCPRNTPLPLSTLFIHITWKSNYVEYPMPKADSCEKKKKKLKGRWKGRNRNSGAQESTTGGKVKKSFFLRVYGVSSEEDSSIPNMTQESATNDIVQVLLNRENVCDSPDEYVLIEEVQEDWQKPTSEKTTQRCLESEERPLEMLPERHGKSSFVLKKITDDPSARAWITTTLTSSNKLKKMQDDSTKSNDGQLTEWSDNSDAALICINNVSPDQPYAVLRSPLSSELQDIIIQSLIKTRKMEDTTKFFLVEIIQLPMEDFISSSSNHSKIASLDSGIVDDDENLFKIQQQWKTKSFIEKEKVEVSCQKKKPLIKASTFSKLNLLSTAKNEYSHHPESHATNLNGKINTKQSPYNKAHREEEPAPSNDVKNPSW